MHSEAMSTNMRTKWRSMMNRCYNPNKSSYDRYGGRGITVCQRWHTFKNFLKDMGECPPGLTLERVNNDKGYSKANCKWATRKEQQLNREGYNKDHCIKGHNLSGWNLSMRRGYKECVTCRRENARNRTAKRRESAASV